MLLATAAVAGCSATVAGVPEPGQSTVDLAILKTGPYGREPTTYDPDPSSTADVRLMEARRTLEYLVHPADVDPDLTEVGDVRFFATPETPFTLGVLPDLMRPPLVDNNMLTGTYISRINNNLRSRKRLIAAIFRFPTDAAAAKAAEDFLRAGMENPESRALSVDGHPEVRSYTRDSVNGSAFYSRGPYTVLINAGIPQPDPAALTRILGAAIDRQAPLLDQLKPTDWDDVLDQPADVDGIMRRALPQSPDFTDPFTDTDFSVYPPAAELHFERYPAQLKKAFEDNGVDLVGRRGGIVYRARDLPAAFRLQTALMAAGRYDEVIDPPPGLPDARCLRLDAETFARAVDSFCTVVHGRYVAVVLAETPVAARIDINLYQRAAAQFAILANSE
ncbi:DUF7373 family lipoprotein [Nocardia bovistercoris]|nr:hypothetical protein [Nocardia bovistercoris]